MTPYEFKAAWPEFSNADNAQIQSRLTVSESLCPESVWTDETRRNEAIGLMTAHALALSPAARDMALAPDGVTVYERRLDELRRITAGGPRTIL